MADSEVVRRECQKIEADLAALKVAFEHYFLGLDRNLPTLALKNLRHRLTVLRTTHIRSTSTRFMVESIFTRFCSYDRMWQRTVQEMENGTYRRDLFKARFRSKKHDLPPAEPVPPPAAAAPAPAPASVKKPAAKATTEANALSDSRLKAVFAAYIKAKKQCNEDTSRITFESVAGSLRKQVPELMKKHKAKGVDFKIVIKDGKASLRALPKNETE